MGGHRGGHRDLSREPRMQEVPSTCVLQFLVCVNERPPGGLTSCGTASGRAVAARLRRIVRTRGVLTQVWVTETGCLGWCHPSGVTVVVWPSGDTFQGVTPDDCEALWARGWASRLSEPPGAPA